MSNEWYTPTKYVEAAREVMGGIDLDPASSEIANKTVKATRYYTEHDNGLLQNWYGRVFCNPPYSRTPEMRGKHQSYIAMFSKKLLSHYAAGDVTQAILLASAQVDAKWFQPLWQFSICMVENRKRVIHSTCSAHASFTSDPTKPALPKSSQSSAESCVPSTPRHPGQWRANCGKARSPVIETTLQSTEITPGCLVGWRNRTERTHEVGRVVAVEWVHVRVLWQGQSEPYWTVEWKLERRDPWAERSAR